VDKKQFERIAEIICDYRTLRELSKDDLVKHVREWSDGFRKWCDDSWFGDNEFALLLEATENALRLGYFSRDRVADVLHLISLSQLEDDLPALQDTCWRWLNLQDTGKSQEELLALLSKPSSRSGRGQHFVYLDDGAFTGATLKRDLMNWLAESGPTDALLLIIHLYVEPQKLVEAISDLRPALSESGIEVEARAVMQISDDLTRAVTWHDGMSGELPAVAPLRLFPTSEMYESDYLASFRSGSLGRARGENLPVKVPDDDIFGSPSHRYVLTRACLEVGSKMILRCFRPSRSVLPFGVDWSDGLGLGTFVATFRNCPNTAPMALWWTKPNSTIWHPLLPRKI